MRREKDISKLTEGDPTKLQRDKGYADVRDYSMRHKIRMFWDLNEDAKLDRVFKLRVDDIEVIIDAEELMRYVRWV
jgi:hypothetical protein